MHTVIAQPFFIIFFKKFDSHTTHV